MTHSLETIGEALFGSRWQTDLAAEIGVSDRTMRRWAGCPDNMPKGAWADIRNLCARRGKTLVKISEELVLPSST